MLGSTVSGCHKHEFRGKVVLVNCDAVFGAAPYYIPVDEAHPLEASHLYGVSKQAAELMARLR